VSRSAQIRARNTGNVTGKSSRDWEIVARELCARGLNTRFAKTLEFLPDENRLIVRASFGWNPEYGQIRLA
jgi:hypothetical protein